MTPRSFPSATKLLKSYEHISYTLKIERFIGCSLPLVCFYQSIIFNVVSPVICPVATSYINARSLTIGTECHKTFTSPYKVIDSLYYCEFARTTERPGNTTGINYHTKNTFTVFTVQYVLIIDNYPLPDLPFEVIYEADYMCTVFMHRPAGYLHDY